MRLDKNLSIFLEAESKLILSLGAIKEAKSEVMTDSLEAIDKQKIGRNLIKSRGRKCMVLKKKLSKLE